MEDISPLGGGFDEYLHFCVGNITFHITIRFGTEFPSFDIPLTPVPLDLKRGGFPRTVAAPRTFDRFSGFSC